MDSEKQSLWLGLIDVNTALSTLWNFVVSSLPSIFLFGLLFFVLSIVLLLVCRRYGLLKRKNKYWNFAVKLNYLYVPAVFVCCGMACGMLFHTKSYIKERHREILEPVSQAAVESITSYLADQEVMKNLEGRKVPLSDLLKKIFGDYYYTPKSDSFVERQKSYLVNQVLARGGRFVLSLAVRKVLEDLCTRAHVGVTIQDEVVEFGVGLVKNMDVSNTKISASTVITSAVHAKVQSLLSGLYLHFFLYLLLFLTPPILEAVLYLFLVKKKSVQAAQVQTQN